MIKIKLSSVMVTDQEKAFTFYTEILGFVKKTEIPMGEYKWLTVVGPNEQDGVELLLEPLAFPPARVYQKALYDAGIPATAFEVADLAVEHKRMEALGVVFKTPPTPMGPITMAVFEDTCGNLIQIYQL